MTEHARAKAWREKHELSREALADLTGYTARAIWWLERGQSPPNKFRKKPGKISEWVWHRYRMMCAGVEAQLKEGKKFKW